MIENARDEGVIGQADVLGYPVRVERFQVAVSGEKLVREDALELAELLSVADRARLPVVHLLRLFNNWHELRLYLGLLLLLQLGKLGQNLRIVLNVVLF